MLHLSNGMAFDTAAELRAYVAGLDKAKSNMIATMDAVIHNAEIVLSEHNARLYNEAD